MEGVSSSENPLASAPLWRPPDDVLHDINAIDIHNARLDLHNRQLPAIDPLVYQKTEIEELNLSRNTIERLEPDIQNLATMRGLDLSDNRLTTLPLELRRCVALEGINLSSNQLRLVPACIPRVQGLKVLDLSHNLLHCLPAEIGQLIKCERLYVNNNRLRALPRQVGQMHKLRRLYAADNELAVVPAELGSLLLLSELDLANNNLSRIPSQVGAMSLRVIRVDGNPLLWPAMALVEEGQEAILAFLRQRDKLHDRDFVVGSRQHFDASSRNTTATDTAVSDEKIESIITQCGIQEDVALDLSSSGLKTLPRNLAGLHKLRQIFLNKNRMEELPLCLCELSDLIGLNLGYNELQVLPAEIGDLALLQALNLGTNRLSALPPTIGRLTSLMVLDLYGNSISRLPAEIGQLRALRRLYVDNNELEELPSELGNLRNLLRLYVGQNQLQTVPRQVFELVGLQELDLRNNQLRQLPHGANCLWGLRSLLWVGLDGNPDLRVHSEGWEPSFFQDGRAAADFCRRKSYQDLIAGNLGSRLFKKIRFRRAEKVCQNLEKSEIASVTAERVDDLIKRADKVTVSRLSRYLTAEYRVADGWPCQVTNLETGVAEKYYMTISDTAIELREPNLIRDDTVYVYLLLEETDVTEIDETTLLVVLSSWHSIEVSTAPAPASSLMVQLQHTLSKQFLAYRAKSYLADYSRVVEKYAAQVVEVEELTQAKRAAVGQLVDLSALVESKLPKGDAFDHHAQMARELSEGARQVVVSKPGQAAGEAPRGSGTLLDINRADIAASVVGDQGLLDELQCQAETLKQDALHLQTSIDTARRRLEAEHGDLMGCIQTDMMAGSSTLCYSMLEASGVSADDAIANKAVFTERVSQVLGAVVRAKQRLAWAKAAVATTRLGAGSVVRAAAETEHGRFLARGVGEGLAGTTDNELVIARAEVQSVDRDVLTSLSSEGQGGEVPEPALARLTPVQRFCRQLYHLSTYQRLAEAKHPAGILGVVRDDEDDV